MSTAILKIIGYLISFSLIFCLYFIFKKHEALRNSDQYEGTVVGLEPRTGSKGERTYALRVEYADRNDMTHTFVTSGASSPPARPVGAKVRVFQHRDGSKPDILVFESVYLGFWIWFCVGIAVTGCLVAPFVLKAIYEK